MLKSVCSWPEEGGGGLKKFKVDFSKLKKIFFKE
jgi:hypothetical protein